jgi:hypothetical protein
MTLLPTGPLTPAAESALDALRRWHGDIEIVEGTSLAGVDFVLVVPGGNADLEERARRAGVRIAEVW